MRDLSEYTNCVATATEDNIAFYYKSTFCFPNANNHLDTSKQLFSSRVFLGGGGFVIVDFHTFDMVDGIGCFSISTSLGDDVQCTSHNNRTRRLCSLRNGAVRSDCVFFFFLFVLVVVLNALVQARK